MPDDPQLGYDTKLSKFFSWVAAAMGFAFMGFVFYAITVVAPYGFFNQIALEHLVSVIGLPCAAVGSLVLVLVLRTVAGNIEFKLWGLEFKGASGPIIMWILCFLAMTLAITKTWDLKFSIATTQHPKQWTDTEPDSPK